MNIFSPVFGTLENALDIITAKHTVIASNIANVDTPGYKAKTIDFREALSEAIKGGSIAMKTSREKHLSGSAVKGSPSFLIKEQVNNFMRNDGNNVNIDEEMVALSKNSIMYDIAVQITSRRFETLKYAISEGRRG